MKRLFGIALLALGLLAATVGLATPAHAATIVVGPGESIQGAVNRAEPGDTIQVLAGVYHESVRVTKNHLTLLGVGGSPQGTVLRPPGESPRCFNGAIGICIFGSQTDQGMKPLVGTTVEGFRFEDFPAFGAMGFGARNTTFRDNVATGNGEYGIACFTCGDINYVHNRAFGNHFAGLYIGDSPNSKATVIHNVVYDNGQYGMFLRDAQVGVVNDNQVFGNCAGIFLLNTGSPNAASGWHVLNNRVHHNDKACPATDFDPPVSGIGIWLLGARNNDVAHNRVWENSPTGPTFTSGGIVLQSSAEFGGSPSSNNEIRSNQIFRNHQADIFWDGEGNGNEFRKNQCNTSVPPQLCREGLPGE